MNIMRIYDEHKNSVYRLALTMLHSEAEAEDVCHDVFLKLIKYQDTIKYGSEKAWLMKVTSNECKDRLRFWKRFEPDTELSSFTYEDPHDHSVFDEVMSLSVKERTVIYLCYYEGYSSEEISKMLNISASAVRSRLERARKHIKTKLEGDLR